MHVHQKLVIGTVLSLVTAIGTYSGFRAHQNQASLGQANPNRHIDDVVWTWVPASGGNSAFAMVVDAMTWSWLAGKEDQEWKGTHLSDETYSRVGTLVESAMRRQTGGCPHHWLMLSVKPLARGSVYLGGRCATDAELRAVAADGYRKAAI